MQVHLVVGEHKADPLVLAQRLAKGGAAAGVVGGDVVGAPRGTQPAHAMRQARRRQPDLGIAKALADPAEDRTLRHPQPVEPDHRVAARHVLIQGVEHPLDDDPRRVHRCKEHRGAGGADFVIVVFRHDDCDFRTDGTGDQPFRAVDDKVAAVAVLGAARGRLQH